MAVPVSVHWSSCDILIIMVKACKIILILTLVHKILMLIVLILILLQIYRTCCPRFDHREITISQHKDDDTAFFNGLISQINSGN